MIWELIEIAALIVLLNFVLSSLSSMGQINQMLDSPVQSEEQVNGLLEKAMSGELLKINFVGSGAGNLFK